mmetsp:Transcript_15264/g.23538  ORF Transcript_15264/g.23538 Transcript_15264/m.23538 type:complete len:84 (+) Transcript_15264:294-545(+)
MSPEFISNHFLNGESFRELNCNAEISFSGLYLFVAYLKLGISLSFYIVIYLQGMEWASILILLHSQKHKSVQEIMADSDLLEA